jgi:outer membrane lipoprotein-sorting protein
MMSRPEKNQTQDRLDQAVEAFNQMDVPSGPPGQVVKRTLAVIASESAKPHTFNFRGVFTMSRIKRIAIAAVIVLAAGVLVSLFTSSNGGSVAFADVLKTSRTVRTVSYSYWKRVAEKPAQIDSILPDRLRVTAVGDETNVFDLTNGKFMSLEPGRKTLTVFTPDQQAWDSIRKVIFLFTEFQNIKDGSKESLGNKTIDGRQAVGFRIKRELPFPACVWTVWADAKTSLPVRIEIAKSGSEVFELAMSDFRFNVDLDESLFDLTPPEGYKVINK